MTAYSIIATGLGYIGTAFLVLSFQCKKEKNLFWCQMASGLFFVLHYGMNGDYTGMAMDGTCFLRALSMASGKKFFTGKKMMCVFLLLILVLGYVTWDGVFSLFPTIALFFSTVFRFMGDGEKISKCQIFCTSLAWLVFTGKVGSVPGIICESLDMGSVIVYALRRKIKRKQ
ncbi:MAG: YgjV family protein [Clostridia bacterium]|nr:YgjV family protein [Clostridia bacterium]